MTRYWWRRCWKLALVGSLALGGVCASSSTRTQAQIKPDTTLPHNSIVMPQGSTTLIDGGTRAGNNLFHSFTQFSVLTGGTAFFDNALDVKNIFSRITGGSISNIDGILKANGTANLFFLNPNGIIFGQNAQLNIGGSFVATTADAIGFGDRGFFSASVTSDNPALLTIDPNVFSFNHSATNSIAVQASLQVPQGSSLLLVGGNVTLDGGQLLAPGGRVELAGLSASGTVGLDTSNNIFHLTFPDGIGRADVSLTNGSGVYVGSDNGGSIAINAQNFNLMGSSLKTGINPNSGAAGSLAGGNIDINAIDSVNLTDGSLIINAVSPGAIGNSGDINITAKSLSGTNTSTISTVTAGTGNAGSVNIHTISTTFDSSSSVFSVITSTGVGNSGDINITTNSLSLTNGGAISASILGRGNAGSVNINAASSATFDRESGVVSSIDSTGVGNGGDINITTSSLSLTNVGVIESNISGKGNAGSINIHAATFDGVGSAVLSSVESTGVGKSGDINITTNSLFLTNNATLSTVTLGNGNAGNVNINASNTINLGGHLPSAVSSVVAPNAVGNAGNINITAPEIIVTNFSQVIDSTAGQGNAGNISINASTIASVDNNGGVLSTVELGGVGNAGNINITAPKLVMTNGSQLEASTKGQGNAGNVNINVSDTTSFDGQSASGVQSGILSSVEPGSGGSGGNITINTGTLSVTNGASLIGTTKGTGNAGNVNINANSVSLDGVGSNGSQSAIASQVLQSGMGKGGDINITSDKVAVTNGAVVSASTFGQGNAGNIQINANSVNLSGVAPSGNSGGLLSTSEAASSGIGGDIIVKTDALQIESGAVLSAGTRSTSNGGNISVDANNLELMSGGEVLTTTFSSGSAGNISINADRATISGSDSTFASRLTQFGSATVDTASSASGIFASTDSKSTGTGGDLTLHTQQLTIRDGAEITASSLGTGNAGNILDITALSLTLDNGEIATTSVSGNGGNIQNIQVQDLFILRNHSQISTTAGTQQSGGGNGGNINLNAGFIVAVPSEDSEITANAFAGNGGNIQIGTQGIFGITSQTSQIPTSEITASSQLGVNGTVQINTPGIDPSRGLVPVPVSPGAPGVVQDCQASSAPKRGSRFISSGRGGLPPNPHSALSSSALWSDSRSSDRAIQKEDFEPKEDSDTIVEAQGWVRGPDRTVILVSRVPAVSSSSPGSMSSGCYAP